MSALMEVSGRFRRRLQSVGVAGRQTCNDDMCRKRKTRIRTTSERGKKEARRGEKEGFEPKDVRDKHKAQHAINRLPNAVQHVIVACTLPCSV
jgi:hypothetical protein